MSSTALLEASPTTTELAEQFYQLLVALDPATWRGDVAARARVALVDLRQRAYAHLETWRPADKESATYAAFEHLATTLPDPGALSDRKSEWVQLRDRVALAYEALRQGTAVMRAGRPDCEHFLTALDQQHRLALGVAQQLPAVMQLRKRDALRQIRS
jgi:hypothetical protein